VSKHYKEFEWIQYLKGLDPSRSAQMLSHAESCSTCRARLAFCREMTEFVESEAIANPPPEWVQDAVNRFAIDFQEPDTNAFFAGLTSDTYLETAVGTRAASVSERRLSFESERFRIEITVDLSGRRLQTIVGNLTRKSTDGEADTTVPVELSVGETTLQGFTNSLGEFYFPVSVELTGGPVELRFRFDGGACLTALIPF
jgi:hypothetical protein